jgi:hypothetical protein
MGTPRYLFDNSATEAAQRFGALAALFNPPRSSSSTQMSTNCATS